MLTAALIGAGHVQFDQYAREFSSHPDCKIRCLWDPDPKYGKECADRYGCEYFSDIDEVLALPEVDAVILCSATSQHPELLIKAAKAKKHIFTEKVLCFSTQDAEAVKKAVEEAGIRFCISFPWRSMDKMLAVKEVVESGVLGQITYARMRNAHNGASAGWLPEHFYDKAVCGGGAMMDLGAHPMYLLEWLLGRPKSVLSLFTSVTGHEVEDNAVSLLEYSNGAIAVSETAFVAEQNPFSLEVCGTKGSLFAGGPADQVLVNTGNGWEPPVLPPAKKGPMDLWIEGILTGSDIPYTIDDAVELTRLMEAAYRSYEEGKKVPV